MKDISNLFYPQPHNLYQLFLDNLHELYNDTGHKLTEERSIRYTENIYELYKYMLYYITFIDTNYFLDKQGDPPNLKRERRHIENFLKYVLQGYSCETDKFDNKSIDLSFINEQTDEIKQLLKQITFSSFHLLFNQTAVVKYLDFCHKDINGLKIDKDKVRENFEKMFKDFNEKTNDFENSKNVLNINKNFNLFTEIEVKTTDNSSVNIYILNQIEELFTYSIMMEAATTDKTKREGELELLNDKLISINSRKIKQEKKLFDLETLKNTLERIKEIIALYESNTPKSQMASFQNMLNEHKKDLHVYERKESSSIIYYILSFIDDKNKAQTEQIFTHFIQKSVDFINNTLNLKFAFSFLDIYLL